MKSTHGKIIIASDVNVWPHEMDTAKALARAGYVIEFIRKSNDQYATSADVLINNQKWEMKSPKSDVIQAIERNVKRARNQSGNIIIDSKRVKKIPDTAIERSLRKLATEIKGVNHLLFVNKRRVVIIIK